MSDMSYYFRMCVFSFDVGSFDLVVFFKQKSAYEMRISDWSSDVCSSDRLEFFLKCLHFRLYGAHCGHGGELLLRNGEHQQSDNERQNDDSHAKIADIFKEPVEHEENGLLEPVEPTPIDRAIERSEEHTSEPQSLMRN